MLDLLPTTVRLRDHRSGIELDHSALVSAVMSRAATLLQTGLDAGARVVLGHDEGVGFVVDLMAAWQIGAAVVTVTPSLTEAERARVAEATHSALWIGAEKTNGNAWLPPPAPICDRADTVHITPAPIALDAPALVLMTSGTTSKPKGVVHSHRSLRARIALNLAYMNRHELDRSLALLPMHFGHGLIGNCLTPLAAGADLTLWPEPGMAGFSMLAEVIDRYGITFMSSVPAMWRIVLKASPAPQKQSLRRVHVGSAPLSAELWESMGRWCGTRRIVNAYGVTETANWIGGYSLEEGDPIDGLVGRPWGGAFRVAGSDGELLTIGEGEVAIASPSLMMAYLDQPELTAKVLRGGWFLTGDNGVIDTEGRLRLIGRRENEINRGGVKIPAEEIDLLLERHPDVADACAFGLEDPVAGEVVAAAVAPARPGAFNCADVLTWCRSQIRREAQPAQIFVVDCLPRTERGKINRDHVKAAVLGTAPGAGSP